MDDPTAQKYYLLTGTVDEVEDTRNHTSISVKDAEVRGLINGNIFAFITDELPASPADPVKQLAATTVKTQEEAEAWMKRMMNERPWEPRN